jgi:xylulokinase
MLTRESPLLISVDLGSSAVKTSLVDASAGHNLATASRAATCFQPHPGITEQQPDEYLANTLETIREVLQLADASPGSVAALALDGQMSGCLGIDRDGHAVTPWSSTLDTRFDPYCDRFVGEHEADIRRLTGGCQPCLGPKIAWMQTESPTTTRRVERFVLLAGYVAARMAGLPADQAFVDTTYLSATGIADVAHASWSADLCAALSIPVAKLPRIVSSFEVIGHLTRESATRCSLLAGTPIVAGAGDQPAGFLGAGMVRPGMLIDVAGTYPVLSLCTDRFAPDAEGHTVEVWPSAIPGLWHALTFIIGGGMTHHWFADMVKHQQIETGATAQEYAELDAAAAGLPPGSEGVLFLPHLGGRACPPESAMRGGWLGLNWAHGEQHLYRAILEAVAYEHALGLLAMRRLFPVAIQDHISIIGGGARSTLWNQIKADVLGMTYESLRPAETAALGAALIAGRGVGLFSDLTAPTRQWSHISTRTQPDPERHCQYAPYVQLYARALDHVGPVFRELAALLAPMPRG